MKYFPRWCVRRSRYSYVLNIILITTCITLLYQVKFHKIKHDISTTLITNQSLCTNTTITYQTKLNCFGEPAQQWCENMVDACPSALTIFMNLFAITYRVILQPKLAKGKRLGGENIQDVLNQAESDEYFNFDQGFIQVRFNRMSISSSYECTLRWNK
jgi:hypothetical protein